MTQWEYFFMYVTGKKGIEKMAQAGKEGWELVSVTKSVLEEHGAWFKRPYREPLNV